MKALACTTTAPGCGVRLVPLSGALQCALFCALFCALCLSSCGARDSLRVVLQRGAGPDPFAGVEVLRVKVTGPELSPSLLRQTAYRAGGSLLLPEVPLGPERVITVEGLDADNLVVARGISEAFALSDDSPSRVALTINRCGLLRYPDGDGDGYGDSAAEKTLCEPVSGFVEKSGDCDDEDAQAKPDQQQFFDAPSRGARSYDYDCDGKETRERTFTADCSAAKSSACDDLTGWIDVVPACGQEGTWVECAKKGKDCLGQRTEAQAQQCR